jgi:hypothetical protein
MPTARVHRFWGALSPAQRRKAIELGHRPRRLRTQHDQIA